jgi:hypothetical protein
VLGSKKFLKSYFFNYIKIKNHRKWKSEIIISKQAATVELLAPEAVINSNRKQAVLKRLGSTALDQLVPYFIYVLMMQVFHGFSQSMQAIIGASCCSLHHSQSPYYLVLRQFTHVLKGN